MGPRGPKMLQDGPKMRQDEPKMLPRGLKMLPKWLQEATRCPKRPQDAPQTVPRGPKMLQDAPKIYRANNEQGEQKNKNTDKIHITF